MVERSLSMREVPGSIPGASTGPRTFFFSGVSDDALGHSLKHKHRMQYWLHQARQADFTTILPHSRSTEPPEVVHTLAILGFLIPFPILEPKLYLSLTFDPTLLTTAIPC